MIAQRIECHFDQEIVMASALPKVMPLDAAVSALLMLEHTIRSSLPAMASRKREVSASRLDASCIAGTRNHADRSIVLQDRRLHLLCARASRAPQRRRQLVMRELGVCHHIFEHVAVVDDDLRPSL